MTYRDPKHILHTLFSRHRFSPAKRVWVTDDVLVRVEARPFAAGAMRECFAMKVELAGVLCWGGPQKPCECVLL